MSDEPSFRKINYSLRPGKNVERKMLAETLARLSTFRPLSAYSYVGFGSVYFTDFTLFHRQFGFSPMYSIEGNAEGIDRAAFNAPFGCIEVTPGKSSEVLPGLPLDRPAVVWLDYDTELHGSILQDVATVVRRQCEAGHSGVFLALTIDIETKRLANPKSVPEDELDDWPEDDPVGQFTRLLGEHDTPPGIRPADLHGEAIGETCRAIVTDKINSTLIAFNGAEQVGSQWEYLQVANFRYSDGAKMGTFGGVLFRTTDRHLVEAAQFDSLSFVSHADHAYIIEIPLLTFREMHTLNGEIGSEIGASMVPVKQQDRDEFAKVYRYFPAFVEAEL